MQAAQLTRNARFHVHRGSSDLKLIDLSEQLFPPVPLECRPRRPARAPQ